MNVDVANSGLGMMMMMIGMMMMITSLQHSWIILSQVLYLLLGR